MRKNVGGGSRIGVDDRLHKLPQTSRTAIIHEVKFERRWSRPIDRARR